LAEEVGGGVWWEDEHGLNGGEGNDIGDKGDNKSRWW